MQTPDPTAAPLDSLEQLGAIVQRELLMTPASDPFHHGLQAMRDAIVQRMHTREGLS